MAKKDKGKSKGDGEVTCKIKKIYGYLSPKKVFVKVSWNDGPYRDEIRRFWTDDDDVIHLGKGIDVSDEEIKALKKLLADRPDPVEFDGIFDASRGIMDARRAGFTTENGFIKLRRRPGVKPKKFGGG